MTDKPSSYYFFVADLEGYTHHPPIQFPSVRFGSSNFSVYNNTSINFEMTLVVKHFMVGRFVIRSRETSSFDLGARAEFLSDVPVFRQDLENEPLKRKTTAGNPAESKGIMEIADVICDL